jgi:hypothetical protein
MTRPTKYLVGMGLISLLGFVGTSSVTIYSLGLLSFVALFLFAVVVTSLPMLFLLWKDVTAIRRLGVEWKKSRYVIYALAIVLPSYVMTPLYWFVSQRKVNHHLTS